MSKKATSPSSTGPAGPNFESCVGAFCFLGMLTGTETFGLPGTTIECVTLQRASEGFPLDDVIVHAKTSEGKPATLEIQAKRKLDFTPSDTVFEEIVGQILKTSQKKEFKTEYYEMAIAIAQTSRKISGSYQDVLSWARKSESANAFFAKIHAPRLANVDMRTFVNTFKTRLMAAGGSDDNETIWQLLRKLKILVFDFGVAGSIFEQLAINQATSILHSDQKDRARSLWEVLLTLTSNAAAVGGGYTRAILIEELKQRSFLFSGYKDYISACDSLTEGADYALQSIHDKIGDTTLVREEYLAAIRNALEKGRYIEIRGDGGVGKSGLLKQFASEQMKKSKVIVLRPGRTVSGGWTAMKADLQFKGNAKELLTDLVSQGSAIIFIDNLDFFSDGERITIIDLVQAAADIQGIFIIVTARRNFGLDEPSWLPSDALKRLGCARVSIDALTSTEMEEIQNSVPEVASLLIRGHPAREAQTLFRLAYLARRPKNSTDVFSETEMASEWWKTVDGMFPKNLREVHRVLNILVKQSFGDLGSIDISEPEQPANIIDQLVKHGILRDLGDERVVFDHDVFREWGIANVLYNNLSAITLLRLEKPARPDLARGIELASRMLLEISTDFSKWKQLLDHFSQPNVHHTWRRALLLGLVRSEIAARLFQDRNVETFLLANNASVLGELIGNLMATDVLPATEILVSRGVPREQIPSGFYIPVGLSWSRIIAWLLTVDQKLSEEAILHVAKLYIFWCEGRLGKGENIPLVLRSLYRWLIEIEMTCRFERSIDCPKPFGHSLDQHLQKELESDLRRVFLIFCDQVPELAMEYLQTLGKRRKGDDAVISVLTFRGVLAQVVPQELAEFTAKTIIQISPENGNHIDLFQGPFDHSFECIFSPASPAQGPFFELLTHAPQYGLSLIHQLTEHAASFFQKKSCNDNSITVDFPAESRKFLWKESYGWSRGSSYIIVASALMALESWAHKRIEAGEGIEKVLTDILGPVDSLAAYLLVAVDLLISHWPKSAELAIPFAACPELLLLDSWRCAYDKAGPNLTDWFPFSKEPMGATNLASIQNRPSRKNSLFDLISLYAIHESDTLRANLHDRISKSVERVGAPSDNLSVDDPRVIASRSLNRVNPANWKKIQAINSDTAAIEYHYVPPEDEARLLFKWKAAQKADATRQAKQQKGIKEENVKTLLEEVVSDQLGTDQKVRSIMVSLSSMNEHLSRSLIRCALAGCVLPKRDSTLSEELFSSHLEQHRQSMHAAVNAELAWHTNKESEPEWPLFPLKNQTNKYINHQGAALWLHACQNLPETVKYPLMLDIVQFYASWTASANDIYAEDSFIEPFPLRAWNNEYFTLLARCFPKLTFEEIEQLALIPICALSDEAFFDMLASFLECVDKNYFHKELQEQTTVNIRSKLADRLMASNGWKRVRNNRSHTIETHIKPAIATFFFNICILSEPPICYLRGEPIQQIDAFLPVIEKLILTGPSLFVAIVALNLIEHAPQARHIGFVLNAAHTWLKKFPEDRFFWIDSEVGRRVCDWIEKTKSQQTNPLHTDMTIRHEMDQLLGNLIKIGVPEASRLEKSLLPSLLI